MTIPALNTKPGPRADAPEGSDLGAGPAVPTLVVLQPGYLPWLGFFDQMRRSDVFVYYDDVQFDKHGWRNRNRVKSTSGAPHWLTVPVRHHGRGRPSVRDIEIDNRAPWARKHIGTLRHFYAQAPYLPRYLPALEELLERRWEQLLALDVAVVGLMTSWLGLQPRVFFASELGVPGARTERLIALCRHFGARRYLSGSAARAYLDPTLFESEGVELVWQDYAHPVYSQQHGEFVPYLSAVDLLFNCGDESARILATPAEPTPHAR